MTDVSLEVVERLRTICLALPDAYEETAWTGVRWCVRSKTFAHVLTIDDGRPEAYARFHRGRRTGHCGDVPVARR